MANLDGGVITYLKTNGMYDAILAQVAKGQPDAGDVHQPSGGGKKKKKPTTLTEPGLDEDDNPPTDVAKRLAAADPVFAKGEAGVYVYRPLTSGSADRLHAWATEAGIPNLVPAELMHVTQVHSQTPVTGLETEDTLLDVPPEGRFLSPLGDKGALVMFLSSPEMQRRFLDTKAKGAQWDFPSYRPHVTLSYDAGADAQEWAMFQAPDFPLQLGPEQMQANNDTWVEDNALRKSDDLIEFEATIEVAKFVPEQQMVFGWASVCSVNGVDVIDKQEDIIPVEEIEKAAYDFVLYSREQGDMHAKRSVGRLIESVVFTPEKAALGLTAKNDNGEAMMGWWCGFKVSDAEVWKAHKEGRRPEFSIGGKATPVEQ